MFRIMILVFLVQVCLLANNFKLNLIDYANLTSIHNEVNILISDEIKANDFYFFTSAEKPKVSLSLFKKMIELKGLKFSKYKNFYFVDKKLDFNSTLNSNLDNLKLFSINLKNNSFNDVQKVLSLYDINSTYTKSNVMYLRITEDKFYDIEKLLKDIDVSLKQIKIKLTIIETDLTKMKERNVEINSFLSKNGSYLTHYLNLITMPYSESTNVLSFKKNNFYSTIKFLDTNGFSKIKSSPLLTAKSNHNVLFSVVQNIPYLTESKEISDNKETKTNSYSYKDVGLKVELKPVVLNDGVDLDLHLIFEDILKDGITPITSKKELRSSYFVKYNDILVLSGLNKNRHFQEVYSLPFLSEIFILGEFFKLKIDKENTTTLSLIIEVFDYE